MAVQSKMQNPPTPPPVITSVEKQCSCCLLHPTGTKSSPFSSSHPLLLSHLIHSGLADRPTLSFPGSNSHKAWHRWVCSMSRDPNLVATWRRAGVEDAILSGCVSSDIKVDRKAMEALSGFWSSATNTFLFPWGEAALSLEDAHAITGLPIAGSTIDRELTIAEKELQSRLIVESERIKVLDEEARGSGKITPDTWLRWFVKLDAAYNELRHLGFLAYWLAKEVIPLSRPEQSVFVFGLAARLSRGERIALAPVVVANVYCNLTAIARPSVSSQWSEKEKKRGGKIKVWAPFGVLQCWIWERFERLRPTAHGSVPPGSRARIPQWSGRQKVSRYEEAVEVFQDERCFTWRPYSGRLSNWVEPEWYSLKSRKVTIEAEKGEDPAWLLDFLKVVSSSSIAGSNGEEGQVFSESYQPHRFAKQFGYDQAIPGEFFEASQASSSELGAAGVEVYIPGITRCGNLRKDYIKWWKGHIKRSREALQENTLPEKPVGDSEKESDNQNVLDRSLTDDMLECTMKKRKSDEICKNDLIGRWKEVGSEPEERSHHSSSLQPVNKRRETSVTIFNVEAIDEELIKNDELLHALDRNELADVYKDDRKLLEELEEFQRLGLMEERELSPPPETEDSNTTTVERYAEDPYGQEAIDHYPNFFRMIPQCPHYGGLATDRYINDDMKKSIFLGQWYLLVSLMGEALSMNDVADSTKIDAMLRKTQRLERRGFDVRHLIARLNQQKQKIESTKLEAARGRGYAQEFNRKVKEEIKLVRVESHINELKSKLSALEKRRDKSKEAIFMTEKERKELEIRIGYLRREVEDAEMGFFIRKCDAEVMVGENKKRKLVL